MSGHSKWSTIKHQKGTADARRGKLFSKLSMQLTLAAKEGGANPESNARLRLAMAAAKAANMPKDNVERAIKRGAGQLGGAQLEEVTFEGYGPGGVAIIVQAITDNRNRASANVKAAFSKHGGRLSTNGSVAYLFNLRGTIVCGPYSDALELTAIDSGALDTQKTASALEVTTEPTQLTQIKDILQNQGAAIESAQLGLVPKTIVTITDPHQEKQVLALLEGLDDLDDVVDVSSNTEFSNK